MVVRVRFARTLRGTTPVANPAHRGETFQRDRDAGLRGNRCEARRRAIQDRSTARVGEDQEPRLLTARSGGAARALIG